MGQISKQLFFNAPLERVWKVWTDVEKTPEWVEGVTSSRITSSTREGKGLAWNERCIFGKKEIQMDHTFAEYIPLQKTVTETGLPMGGTMQTTAEFSATPPEYGRMRPLAQKMADPSFGGKPAPQTEVNLALEWDLGMIGAMIGEEKLHHMMEKSFDLTAAKWKEKAEKS